VNVDVRIDKYHTAGMQNYWRRQNKNGSVKTKRIEFDS
jgi:hypothetical protein